MDTKGMRQWHQAAIGWSLLLFASQAAAAQDATEPTHELTASVSEAVANPTPGRETGSEEVLVCEGGWQFPLYETRRELGPARLSRLLEIQQDIVLSERAFDFCQQQSTDSGLAPMARGACDGLLAASQGIKRVSQNLFATEHSSHQCILSTPDSSGECEHVRDQLTTLRRYQRVGVQRAALVASHEVCASPNRSANASLRDRCLLLESSISQQGEAGATVGNFGLSAPLPESVARSVEQIRQVTDGHFLNLVPEDYLGVREGVCEKHPGTAVENPWTTHWDQVRHSLCAELSMAISNADSCRQADIYIDERGQLHLGNDLRSRSQRRSATLCIDISDFDGDHPLMVTLGLEPTASVPERIWPGETVVVGHWIDKPARAQDVLKLSVFGKARGVSLKEVLRINGADSTGQATGPANAEACRIARAWVPVVDHEIPLGPKSRQAVIPVDFGRGRDGETATVHEGSHLLVWVRQIEPAGAVLVEYAGGQSVSFEPPPLLGTSEPVGARAKIMQHLRGGVASVAEPLLPRRARYPGSRVLRLGSPAGGSEYGLRICVHKRANQDSSERACDSQNIIVNERLFVHGTSHMGLQVHVGYSFFRTPGLTARRTAAARSAGENLYEIVEDSEGSTSQDIALLLAVYPFGRDPLSFSPRPWSASYWQHAALLAGFSVRKISVWEDLYLGVSLPLANGVSASALAHFARRDVPNQTSSGQFLNIVDGGGESLDLRDYVATQRSLSVGIGVGISFDLNLFQKAFSSVWERVSTSQSQFYSSGR